LSSAPQNIVYFRLTSSCCLGGGGGDEGQQAARLGSIVSGPDVSQGVALPHLALVLLQAGRAGKAEAEAAGGRGREGGEGGWLQCCGAGRAGN
jgi:hypothetical protein